LACVLYAAIRLNVSTPMEDPNFSFE